MKISQRKKQVIKNSSILNSILGFVIIGVIYFLLDSRGGYNAEAQLKQTNAVNTAINNDQNKSNKIKVPVLIEKIAAGMPIDSAKFVEIEIIESDYSYQYVKSFEELINKKTLSEIAANNPIPVSSLGSDSITKNAVVEEIPAGMRAITVKVDQESAIEGWAQAGNYVDLILIKSFAGTQGATSLEAKVISENIKILSTGGITASQSTEKSTQIPSTVTLLVSQEDALKIKTADSIGKLTFALRGLADKQPTIAKNITQNDFLDHAKKIKTEEEQFKGYAKSSDGKVFVLKGQSRWTVSKDSESPMDIK